MKMNIKRFLALALAFVLVLSYVPGSVFATGVAEKQDLAENPELPTATVTPLSNEDLTFALTFAADEVSDEQLAYYGDWYADFVLTVNKEVTFDANDSGDGWLSGHYEAFSENWVNVPFEPMTLAANTPFRIMEYAANYVSMQPVTYGDVYGGVHQFDCGAYFDDEFLAANPDLEVALELRIYNPANESEHYTVGEAYEFTMEDPELPTATVTPLSNEDLTFALTFAADEVSDEQLAYYGDWYADFVLTVNKEVTFDANDSGDGWLSGHYEAFSENWVNVPFEPMTLAANTPFRIMEYAANYVSMQPVTYGDVYGGVHQFDCGAYFDDAFLAANPDLEVTLELRIYNPADTSEFYTIGEAYEFSATAEIPTLPTATVGKIENDDLTFAMNFKADDVTAAQKAYYGDWYADFELTINKDVTFNANGGADGYLSGQYDAWSENWVNVPFKNVTLNAGETLKIMAYAAESMGEPGLKYTCAEVYEVVKDFDCGIFFEPAFLAANPDLKVTLELKMYDPEDETVGHTIGETYVYTIPTLPTATVAEIENDDLTFAMNFKADDVTAAQKAYYGNWYADFELTINKDVTFNANGGADGYLSGQYDAWSENWVNVPFKNVTLNAGETLKIMAYAAESMGEPGLKYTYAEVYDAVKDFDCGVFFEPAFLAANPDLKVTLELKMYNPHDESINEVIGETYVYTIPTLPTATVAEIENDDLTFAMNFKADDVTAAQKAYYGNWYADFELTVNKDVTFNANGGADGYLSGQYDAWSENWVNVPFKNVTLNAGETLKIMAYAAESMGEPGLKYTYAEVYDAVKDFDCGVFFEDAFLAANPDLEVTLELKMYNPHDESINEVIGTTYTFKNEYVAYNVETGKLYTKASEAVAKATANQTVRLLKSTTDGLINVLDGVTLDLNGYTLEATYMFSVGDVVDNSTENTGTLKVSAQRMMLRMDNRQLPVNTAEGYKFYEILGFNAANMVPEKENATKYAFQPKFEAAAHEALLAGNATSNVTIGVRVTWPNDQGGGSQLFTYSDEMVKAVLNSYRPNDGGYDKMYTLLLNGTDAYPGLSCQGFVAFNAGSTNVEIAVASVTESETNLNTSGATAVVPEGTKVTGSLALKVTDLESSSSNITVAEGETLKSVDVHVNGVAADNTVPVLVTVENLANAGLNNGNLKLYHVEKGVSNKMTQVATLAEVDEHNEFWYDPATGNVTMALATFSEIALVAEPARWEGVFDYNWYDASKTELLIANADQLAGFGAIVGGMNSMTADDFAGKTVKLINNIVIGDLTDEDGRAVMFYPIGYYNTTESYVKKAGVDVTSGFRNFSGTFDGNGHVISDFYQNTWEAFGDYNDGYSGTPNHYRDGFGLFGKVYKGTVKNLTVRNFQSDGEYTTTGTIAAYAEGATFENIAIFDCNPRVYNIGNGGIVGCVGWYAKEAGLKTTFKNITVDNTNKISALWGSWDVACGGIVGQYYPTSGQTSANKPANGGIRFENCHVAAQIDVYNDVCANYQYYAYRYAGILMGSVRENVIENGHEYPNMTGITAANCTVHFGDWNDYYYCELVANSLASYTHDHQMSRLTQVQSVDVDTMKIVTLEGKEEAIPTSGAANYVVVKAKDANGMWIHGDGKAYATCYHFVNGAVWDHANAGSEEVDVDGDGVKETVLKEDKQLVYREFNNLVTGYGWGVTSMGVKGMDGVEILDREEGNSVKKFAGTGKVEIFDNTPVKVSELFSFVDNGVELKKEAVTVTITDLDDADGISTATFTPNGEDWENATLTVSGVGAIEVTIQDYYFCEPTTVTMNVLPVYPTMLAVDGGKAIFGHGDAFDQGDDFVAIAAYNNGTTKDVTASVKFDAFETAPAGVSIITVSYTENGTTVTTTYETRAKGVVRLAVTAAKAKFNLNYTFENDDFNVLRYYSDGTSEKITDYKLSSEKTNNTAGQMTITVSYNALSADVTIDVMNINRLDGTKQEKELYWFDCGVYSVSNGVNGGNWPGYTNYGVNLGSYEAPNGETVSGFNWSWQNPATKYNPNSLTKAKQSLLLAEGHYNLTIDNALPYTTLGIGCIAGYAAPLKGYGYIINGDAATLQYTAVGGVYTEANPGLIYTENYTVYDVFGPYNGHAQTQFTCYEFKPGESYTVTWVAVFDDGIQKISDWTVNMAPESENTKVFVDDANKPNVNVIILAGQSNMYGASPITPEVRENYSNVDYSDVFIHYNNINLDTETGGLKSYYSNSGFDTYTLGIGAQGNNYFGPEAAIAKSLATSESTKGEQWYIIKYTAAGTGLKDAWLTGTVLNGEPTTLYASMKEYIASDIAKLEALGNDVQIRGFLWMQGENDALTESAAVDYAGLEEWMINDFRGTFAANATRTVANVAGSGIAFIDAGIADYKPGINAWEFASVVNNAKISNCQELYNNATGVLAVNPDQSGAVSNSIYIFTNHLLSKQEAVDENHLYSAGDALDGAHYAASSMDTLGGCFALGLQYMMGK